MWRAITNDGFLLNAKWGTPMRQPDVWKAIKRGLLRVERTGATGRKRKDKRMTMAVITPKGLKELFR